MLQLRMNAKLQKKERKMILIDISNLMMASVSVNQVASKSGSYGSYYHVDDNGISENLLRHMILNSIRSINQTFKHEYGNIIICADSKSWRYKYFPEYKASRKQTRKKSHIDFAEVYKILNVIIDELEEYFPYPIIKVDGAEADDIIAVLSKYSNQKEEKTLIVGNDKDFIQLIDDYVDVYAKIKKTLYKLPEKISNLESYL